ncbi:hypothetical protein IT408_01525 [Candidatus Uhrbacteria bacterium]|nr:hypothetical protein [Candidatus Uhrbacteria bacterium]
MHLSRITIFPRIPYWNSDFEKDQAFRVLFLLGVDVGRLYEPKSSSDEFFIQTLKRIRGIVQGTEKPFVILTETLPLPSSILAIREQFVRNIPALEQAIWIIWYDASRDVGFRVAAEKVGFFDTSDLDRFPILTTKNNAQYLIATPMSIDRDRAQRQIAVFFRKRSSSIAVVK